MPQETLRRLEEAIQTEAEFPTVHHSDNTPMPGRPSNL